MKRISLQLDDKTLAECRELRDLTMSLPDMEEGTEKETKRGRREELERNVGLSLSSHVAFACGWPPFDK